MQFPYQLDMDEGTYEVDRDQGRFRNVLAVYETFFPSGRFAYEPLERGRLILLVIVHGKSGEDHSSEVCKEIKRAFAVPEGLEFQEHWRWIYRRADELCAQTVVKRRLMEELF